MTQFTTVKVSMGLIVPAHYADWGTKALAEYMNNKLYSFVMALDNEPEFFLTIKEEDIILIGKETV